jgi:hypothetical protein
MQMTDSSPLIFSIVFLTLINNFADISYSIGYNNFCELYSRSNYSSINASNYRHFVFVANNIVGELTSLR